MSRLRKCSIVIPVHGHAGLTHRCLEALFAAPSELAETEIVVVDDGSPGKATRRLLESYGDRILAVPHSERTGFAAACNDGAATATGEMLVFLNNDTEPASGWLDALVAYADAHPSAAVVGAKLLFPDRTIQHAGVVICQDRLPRHLYAGFPGDHPAVNKSRRFQAVTAACALVRREVFEDGGGFDAAFRNGFEDVDFCLRAGALGHEIHYCHESVAQHLESASRATRSADVRTNLELYRSRWGEHVRPDDLDYYVEDGLLAVRYGESYPVWLGVSPLLAELDEEARMSELEELLVARARHVSGLLRETVRLTARVADLELRANSTGVPTEGGLRVTDSWRVAEADEEAMASLHDLQTLLADALCKRGTGDGDRGGDDFRAGSLGYHSLVRRVRDLASSTIPDGATVLVVSSGDEELLKLGGRRGWHFPQSEDGVYAGYHPADSAEAIVHLEQLQAHGAEFLVFPSTSMWWLDHYTEFRRHLERRYRTVAHDPSTCVVFSLVESAPCAPPGRSSSVETSPPYAEPLEFIRTVAPGDQMYASAKSPKNYFEWGSQALRCIELALQLAEKQEVESILDLPSGHGRVLRMLRARFPEARLTACDVLEDAIEFCAKTFAALPVLSREEPHEIELTDTYDLIWCGSLLTHLPAERWHGFLQLFANHLLPGGLLVFTTHGRRIAELAQAGTLRFAVDVDGLVTDYERTGFAFRSHRNTPRYGISLSSPAWVCRELALLSSLRLVAYTERGWWHHQDVIACVAQPSADGPGIGREAGRT